MPGNLLSTLGFYRDRMTKKLDYALMGKSFFQFRPHARSIQL
jgi:hypothetical protein